MELSDKFMSRNKRMDDRALLVKRVLKGKHSRRQVELWLEEVDDWKSLAHDAVVDWLMQDGM